MTGAPHPLRSFRLKMNRAKEHGETLKREIDAWFDRKPYEVFGEYQTGPPEEYIFRVRFFEEVPPGWSVILGDFAHNARSAFDHLANNLVSSSTTTTQFPIVLCPFEWERESKRRLKGASKRHIAMAESIQPYHRLYGGYSWIYSSVDDPLAILGQLSRIDKHRVLNPTPATIRSIGYDMRPVRDIASFDLNKAEVSFEPLVDGAKMLSLPVIANGPDPKMYLQRKETVEIRVEYEVELTPNLALGRRVDLKQALDDILVTLDGVFEVFVDEFV
jgi:hypothetical protein